MINTLIFAEDMINGIFQKEEIVLINTESTM
jgi:hypothetical protein